MTYPPLSAILRCFSDDIANLSRSQGERVDGDRKVIHFKECPRCRGDLHSVEDMYGEYRECLQCGHVEDIQRKPSTRESRLPDGRKSRRSVEAA